MIIDGAAGSDTAVCIYGRGVFITSARSVGDQTKVRLRAPWLPDGKNAFELLVWQVDKPHDLAVLVPEKPFAANFASLSLGDAQSLTVKAPVTFLGFSTENKTNPSDSVLPPVKTAEATVVSLPQANDKAAVIRLLAASPKMKAGGPLLDRDNRVVGLMRTVEVMGSKPSTAIPVTTILTALLPKVTVKAAPTNTGKRGAAQQLFIALETAEQHGGRIPGDTGVYNEMTDRPLYNVELTIGDGKNWRASPVSRVQAREFVATDIRIADEKKPLFYKINVSRDTASLGALTGPLALLPEKASPVTQVLNNPPVTLVPVPLVPEAPREHGLQIQSKAPADKAPDVVVSPNASAPKVATAPLNSTTPPQNNASSAPNAEATMQDDGEKILFKLPGQVTDVAVGGAGRYIALYFQALRKIAIFDVKQSKIERYISVAGDEAYLTAGLDKLVVILPQESIIQRWNLLTGERELSTLLPGGFIAAGAAMGAASQGPIAVAKQSEWGGAGSGGPIVFFDLQKLQPMDVKIVATGLNQRGIEGKNVRASADGTLFSAWVNDGSPRMGNIAVLHGSVLSQRVGVADVGLVLPSPDGRTIYTSVGLFSPDMQALDPRPDGRRNEEIAFIPSYSSAFYLGINGSNRYWRGGGFGDRQPPAVELSLYSANDRRLITKLATLDEMGDPMAGMRSSDRLPADKRIFFVPEYNSLITLSSARDQLVLRPINLLSTLNKLDVDYLFVKSRPVEDVTIGHAYIYPIEVVARRAVTFKLESGPPGMTLSEKGLLAWTPPANYVGEEEVVIVSIHDAAGQDIFHTFRIKVQRAP